MSDRGFRNNNPGNIRKGIRWQGLSLAQTDPDFCVFVSPQWGLRAIAKILLSYESEGINTIEAAIKRWAPPSDNNPTDAYVETVCNQCSVEATQPIKLSDYLLPIIKAIVLQENGSQPYRDDVINTAIGLAE
jgi:hypothetical protein